MNPTYFDSGGEQFGIIHDAIGSWSFGSDFHELVFVAEELELFFG
jgi:hypothetical protein